MQKLVINGGKPLKGEVNISGAKNSILPILAATLICEGESIIHNCPYISDVKSTIDILRYLGCEATYTDGMIRVCPGNATNSGIPEHMMCKMRSSIIFLGALLAKIGKATLTFPGGCDLGPRPIDLHINSLKMMGISINEQGGCIDCKWKKQKTKDTIHISLSFPSVGATENIILSAVTATGTTIITNAAREPEIVDFINFLKSAGAKIYFDSEGTITIEGVRKLHGVEYTIIPDRIEATTFMAAVAMTKGDIKLCNVNNSHLSQIIPLFEYGGCKVIPGVNCVRLISDKRLNALDTIRTMPYPGFPTDAQAIMMSVAGLSKGTTIFIESMFQDRYKHVRELAKLGANIHVEGKIAIVKGVEAFCGAKLKCTDLRGAAAVVIAAIASDGKSVVENIYHIDRGYENFVEKLKLLEVDVKKIEG